MSVDLELAFRKTIKSALADENEAFYNFADQVEEIMRARDKKFVLIADMDDESKDKMCWERHEWFIKQVDKAKKQFIKHVLETL